MTDKQTRVPTLTDKVKELTKDGPVRALVDHGDGTTSHGTLSTTGPVIVFTADPAGDQPNAAPLPRANHEPAPEEPDDPVVSALLSDDTARRVYARAHRVEPADLQDWDQDEIDDIRTILTSIARHLHHDPAPPRTPRVTIAKTDGRTDYDVYRAVVQAACELIQGGPVDATVTLRADCLDGRTPVIHGEVIHASNSVILIGEHPIDPIHIARIDIY